MRCWAWRRSAFNKTEISSRGKKKHQENKLNKWFMYINSACVCPFCQDSLCHLSSTSPHLFSIVTSADSRVGLLWTWSHRPKGQQYHSTSIFRREAFKSAQLLQLRAYVRAPKPHASSFFFWGLPRGVAKFPIYGEVFSTYQWKARHLGASRATPCLMRPPTSVPPWLPTLPWMQSITETNTSKATLFFSNNKINAAGLLSLISVQFKVFCLFVLILIQTWEEHLKETISRHINHPSSLT